MVNQNQRHFEVTSAQLTQNAQLGVWRLGIRESMPPGIISRPAGNNSWLLMLFHSPVSIDIAGEGLAYCPADTMIVWQPGAQHHYGNELTNWLHTWIHLSGEMVDQRLGCGLFTAARPFSLPDPQAFVRFVEDIFDEIVLRAQPDCQLMIQLLDLWIRRHELSQSGSGPHIPHLFLEVKGWMETSYQQRIHLADLAARVNLSTPRFCALFKQYFGTAAIDYLVRLRMQHAAFLLHDSNMSIGRAGALVGYDDPYHFSKLFKKTYATTPRAFRARLFAQAPERPIA